MLLYRYCSPHYVLDKEKYMGRIKCVQDKQLRVYSGVLPTCPHFLLLLVFISVVICPLPPFPWSLTPVLYAQTELGAEDDLTVLGTNGGAEDPDVEVKGFTVFGSTQGSYSGAVAGTGNIVVNGYLSVSSGAYFVGNSTFTGANKIFINDGTAGQVLRKNGGGYLYWDDAAGIGDSLGSHVATKTLDMNSWNIINVSSVNFKSNVYVSSASPAQLLGLYISSNIYVAGVSSAAQYYGDGSGLDSIPGDNLGNHVATTTLQMGAYGIVTSSDITAARYQINGSTMLAILPGVGSFAVGFDMSAGNTGDYNLFVGSSAGRSNAAGGRNSFLGNAAGYNNNSGGNNSFLGYQAGYSNTTGAQNSFIGTYAGYNNTTGSGNILVGYSAGWSNIAGNYNSFLGAYAGYYNISGENNSFLGHSSGYNNTSGSSNTFAGAYAGYNNTIGSSNTFIGAYAGYSNISGDGNSFLGAYAGSSNTTGGSNSFLGSQAGYNNTTGGQNSFLGAGAGYFNTTGFTNSIVGSQAGYYNQTGSANTILGSYAGYGATSQSFSSSSIMGSQAGFSLTTGSDNTLLGYKAGYNIQHGTGNIVIGYAKDTSATGANNELNIGGVLYGDLSAKTIGISTRAPQAALDIVSTGTASNVYAQIWRDSDGVIKASMTADGKLYADLIASVPRGDSLGNHIATTTLQMGNFAIVNVASITANGYIIANSTITVLGNAFSVGTSTFVVTQGKVGIGAAGPLSKFDVMDGSITIRGASAGLVFEDSRRVISSETVTTLGAGIRVSTNIYIVGFSSSAKYYGDGSALTNVPGDSLGNHVATTTLQMGAYGIVTSSDVTAARYQIDGSTVLAILPGSGSFAVGVDISTGNTGNYNLFAGSSAGRSNTGGGFNTFVGYNAGRNNATSNHATFVGYNAGKVNSTGLNNTFLGSDAGSANTKGGNNTFLGNQAGSINTLNSNNTFVGHNAGRSNTTGEKNTALGAGAGLYNITGSANAIFGEEAGYGVVNNSFSSSTLMGYRAGYGLTAGGDNILVGFQSGYAITTGTGNLVIGYDKDISAVGAGNELNIGGVLYGDLSAKTIGISTRVPQAALDLVSTGTASNVYAQIWRNSDGVIKASMTADGKLYADIMAPISGDNLGMHTATTTLNMNAYNIVGVSTISVNSITATGAGVTLSTNVFVGGSIGIGTTRPGARFDIEAAGLFLKLGNTYMEGDNTGVRLAGRLQFNDDGSAGSPIIHWGWDAGDSNTGIFHPGPDIMAFTTGGTERIRFNSSGNVGVGTTAPLSRFDVVNGSITVRGTGAGLVFEDSSRVVSAEMSAALGAGIKISTNVYIVGFSSAAKYYGDASALTNVPGDGLGDHVATATLNVNSWNIANVPSVNFKSNVDISSASLTQSGGVYISSHVYMAGRANASFFGYSNALVASGSSNGSNVTVSAQGGGHGAVGGTLALTAGNASDTGSIGGNVILQSGFGFPPTPGYIAIKTYEGSYPSQALAERLRIVGGSGNIGIGTTSPLSKFDVMDGSVTVRGAGAGLILENSSRVISPETSITAGAGIKISTNVYIVGFSSAAKYYGDGSALTNVPGDNLGNHVATTTLQMGVYGIVTSSVVTAAHYQIDGSTVLAILPGSGSFAVGVDLPAGNTGNYNLFVGSSAGRSNTIGGSNSFLGNSAGYNNSSGSNNSFFGYSAGYYNTTGSSNTFAGAYAGYNNITGSSGTFAGVYAGYSNTVGDENSFFGAYAGSSNTTGGGNSFLGYQAGYNNTIGGNNSFLGANAGYNNIGAGNSIAGSSGGYNTQTGSANAIFGSQAGYGATNQSFSSSTIMGSQAGFSLTTGSDNILLGFKAGYNIQNGTGNIVIGYNKDTSAASASNELNIGGVLYGDLSARTIGISTRVPQAALDIVSTGTASNAYAQIWRDSNGVIMASMTADGKLYTAFLVSSDHLGNHVATTTLNMNPYDIVNVPTISVSSITATGTWVTFSTNVVISGNAGIGTTGFLGRTISAVNTSNTTLGGTGSQYALTLQNKNSTTNDWALLTFGGNDISSPGPAAVIGSQITNHASEYGDIVLGTRSSAAGLAEKVRIMGAGNIGIGITAPTHKLRVEGDMLAASSITANGDITAARYQINGSTVLAIFPGSGSFAVGVNLSTGSTGNYNLFSGYNAGLSNTSGGYNTFLGYQAGQINSTASSNTFVGYWAGQNNTTGENNVLMGSQVGNRNTTGQYNVFMGHSAGYWNTAGSQNTFIGYQAGVSNTISLDNTFAGYWAGENNNTGDNNSFLGAEAGQRNSTGYTNTLLGYKAGYYTQTGSANSMFGVEAGKGAANNALSSTTLMGYQAGYALTTGNDNILIGFKAGYNVQSGTRNIVIGYEENTWATGSRNELNIGGVIYGRLLVNKSIGISTRTPAAMLDILSTGTASNVYAQIWRNSNGVIKASMTADGTLFYALVDNLGNHVATTTLNMSAYNVIAVSTISVSSITTAAAGLNLSTNVYISGNAGIGTTMPLSKLDVSGGSITIRGANAALVFEDSSRVISSETAITLGAGIRVSTNVYIVGFSSAAKYYGDGSALTGVPVDNLGNHEAGATLQMGAYGIVTSSDITAARYQISGSTVLAILPGTGGFAVGADITTGNTGDYNLFVGSSAGRSNTSGVGGTFAGHASGYNNTAGISDSFLGAFAGYSNTTGSSNTFAGYQAGYSNTTGSFGTYLGFQSGHDNATAPNNTFVGSQAGYKNTMGSNNSFLGASAGYSNTTGSSNTFVGSQAGYSNTVGEFNSVLGSSAGYNSTTGSRNAIVGSSAAYNNQTGSANVIFGRGTGLGAAGQSFSSSTIIGSQAGFALTNGSDNILLGFKTGYAIQNGTGNIVIGYAKDTSETGASNELNIGGVIYGDLSNKAIGISTRVPQAALDIVSTGTMVNQYAQIWRDSNGVIKASMTVNGNIYAALPANNLGNHVATTTLQMGAYGIVTSSNISAAQYQINGSTALAILAGTGNFAVGVDLPTGNTGNYNLFVGSSSGRSNTTGSNNTFLGNSAGYNNTIGENNSFLGASAGYSNTTGSSNTFVGYNSGYNNTTGENNSFVGAYAGYTNSIGGDNTFLGYQAGYYTTSSRNSFMGGYAGYNNTTGSDNTFIGASAGYINSTGNNNSLLGANAGYNNTTGENNSVIGSSAGYNTQTGSANAIFGNAAGFGAAGQSFSSSTIMGSQAGFALTTGSDNILLGFKAGYAIQNGTGNIVIGYAKDASASSASNELNIGGVLYGNLSAKTIGISTRAPQAALDIVSTGTASNVYAQIWRDSNGVPKSTMTADGTFYTSMPASWDNLGSHVAGAALQMGAYGIVTSSVITAARYQINGSTVLAILGGSGSFGVGVDITNVNTGNYNVFAGPGAGHSNTTGQQNAFLGYGSGYNNNTAPSNTFLGYIAGQVNTTGSNNSFIGAASGGSNTIGALNVTLGLQAGYMNTTGSNNSVVGSSAAYSNQTGSANAVFGNEAGRGGGGSFSSSTIMGYRAGYGLTTGSDNIFVGFQAGYAVTSGTGNIVIGYSEDTYAAAVSNQLNIGGVIYGNLFNKTIGISTRVPQAALDIVSTGTASSVFAQRWRDADGTIKAYMGSTGVLYAFGEISAARYLINGSTVLAVFPGNSSFGLGTDLSTGSTGDYNLFVGSNAGHDNTTGFANTFVGQGAGRDNSTGYFNTFLGAQAGANNTIGSSNTFVGYYAGPNNTTGSSNTFAGAYSGYTNTTGADNSIAGSSAGYNNQTGSANTIFGNEAGKGGGGSFSSSTLLGYQAGYGLTTGNDNILVGYKAGYNITSGTGNIIIGYNLNAYDAATKNEINIGGVYKGLISSGTATIPKYTVQAADTGITLDANDFGKTITVNNSDLMWVYLPSASAAYIGATITVVKSGSGQVRVDAAASNYIMSSVASGSVFCNGDSSSYATITLRLIDATRWVIISSDGGWLVS